MMGLALLAAALSFGSPATNNFIRGDVNGDSVVDLSDALFLLAYFYLGSVCVLPCEDAADANDDGEIIGVSDAVYLLTFLFQGSAAPPEPGMTCGGDPTNWDLLNCRWHSCYQDEVEIFVDFGCDETNCEADPRCCVKANRDGTSWSTAYGSFDEIPEEDLKGSIHKMIWVKGGRSPKVIHPDDQWRVVDKENITIAWDGHDTMPVIRQYEEITDQDEEYNNWCRVEADKEKETDPTNCIEGTPTDGSGLWYNPDLEPSFLRFKTLNWQTQFWSTTNMDVNNFDSEGARREVAPNRGGACDGYECGAFPEKVGQWASTDKGCWVYVPSGHPMAYYKKLYVVQKNKYVFEFNRCRNIKIRGLRFEYGHGLVNFTNFPEVIWAPPQVDQKNWTKLDPQVVKGYLQQYVSLHGDYGGLEISDCETYMVVRLVAVQGGRLSYSTNDPDTKYYGECYQTFVSDVYIHDNRITYSDQPIAVQRHARGVLICHNSGRDIGGGLSQCTFVYCGDLYNRKPGLGLSGDPTELADFEPTNLGCWSKNEEAGPSPFFDTKVWTERNVEVVENDVSRMGQGYRHRSDGWFLLTDSRAGGVVARNNEIRHARQVFAHNGGRPYVAWESNHLEDVFRMGLVNDENDGESRNDDEWMVWRDLPNLTIRHNCVCISDPREPEETTWTTHPYMEEEGLAPGVAKKRMFRIESRVEGNVVIEDNTFVGGRPGEFDDPDVAISNGRRSLCIRTDSDPLACKLDTTQLILRDNTIVNFVTALDGEWCNRDFEHPCACMDFWDCEPVPEREIRAAGNTVLPFRPGVKCSVICLERR